MEEGTVEDMEEGTRAGMVVTLVATQHIIGVMSVAIVERLVEGL